MAKKGLRRKKAYFITLEGLEGSGKSSVIDYLAGLIRKKKFSVLVLREPGSTRVGEKIRRILLDKRHNELSSYTELLLYLAARTQLIEEKLKKALFNYDFIICDRFFDSTIVYQGYALGLGPVVKKAVDIFSLAVKPDLTLFLDTPVNDGLSRLKNRDRIESRPVSFHRKLRKGYLLQAKKYSRRIKIVDAKGSLACIFKRVETVLPRIFHLGTGRNDERSRK